MGVGIANGKEVSLQWGEEEECCGGGGIVGGKLKTVKYVWHDTAKKTYGQPKDKKRDNRRKYVTTLLKECMEA